MALRTPNSVRDELVNAVDQINTILATLTKRIEALEARSEAAKPNRKASANG